MHSINPKVKRNLKGEVGIGEKRRPVEEGITLWKSWFFAVVRCFLSDKLCLLQLLLSNWKPDIGKCLEMLIPQ